jgi:hypothetical protein
MNLKFTHYLITRFNVPVNNWNKDKAGNPVLDAQWMGNRLELFANYCVPTITQQTQKNFIWLIYCDESTLPIHLDRIQHLVSHIPNVQIRLVPDFDQLLTDIRTYISLAKTPYVITSRMDNDDGLGPIFMADVQDHFLEQDMTIINFTKGVLYDQYKRVLTEIKDSQRNHYGSLIEQTNGGKGLITVVGYPHGLPPAGSHVLNIQTRFAWLKIIHQRNMASKTNGIPLLQSGVSSHFNLPPDAFAVSYWNTFLFAVKRMLSKMKRKLISS